MLKFLKAVAERLSLVEERRPLLARDRSKILTLLESGMAPSRISVYFGYRIEQVAEVRRQGR